jgi:hypothetical protein
MRTDISANALSSQPECFAWDVDNCSNGQTAFKEVLKTLYDQIGVDYLFQNSDPDQPNPKAHLTHKWARTQ